MRCSACGFENPKWTKFCGECGTKLLITGTGLVLPSEGTSPRLSPEPERKHVTALFSDLTGYTSMTEKLDPEQIERNGDGWFRIPMDEIRFDWVAHWLRDKSKRGESHAHLH